MSSDYWPAQTRILTVPLGNAFWAAAWAHVADASAQQAQLTVISHAHWPLAELAAQAADAARQQARSLALPQMVAVPDWLEAAVLRVGQVPVTALQRQLLVQQALAQAADPDAESVSDAARGTLARRLVDLLDELDVAQFPLSNAAKALAKQTAAEPFASGELAMANAVAQALADVPGPVQQQLKALRALSGAHQHPLMLIAPDRRSWPLMRAIARVWQGAVQVLIPAWQDVLAQTLAAPPQLRALAARLQVIEAGDLEGCAQSAAQTVATILGNSPAARIHVAALDRRAARRMRALLERAAITVADASGWRLSTTAGAAAVTRLLDIVQREELADLLDWAKLPAVVASELGLQGPVLGWFEHWVRTRGVVRGLGSCAFRLRSLATDDPADAQARDAALAWVEQMQGCTRQLKQSTSVRRHAQRLMEVLAPVLTALRADTAGAQIEHVLRALSFESAPQTVDFNGFGAVLLNRLEDAFLVSMQQGAQVLLLPLNAAAWRSADHVMVLGAQKGMWPQPPPAQAVLSLGQCRALGLAAHDDGVDALQVLLARDVALTCFVTRAQADSNFDASAWLESVRGACRREAVQLDWRAWTPPFSAAAYSPLTMPAPRTPFVPGRLSASAVQAMLACPYQFFALRLLGLAPLDSLDDMPDRQDFGILAHDWVKSLHDAGVFGLPSQAQSQSAAQEHLRAKVARFAKDREHAAQYAAFEMLLMRVLPSLVQWGREAAKRIGAVQAEAPVERRWTGPDAAIVVHGRLDRLARDATEQAWHVIDFKTAAISSLEQRIRAPWHYPQLLIYGWLLQAGDAQAGLSAGYVSLSGEAVSEVGTKSEYAQPLESIGQALDQALRGLASGAALPAHGDAHACASCSAAGVCRKGHWA